MGVKLRAFYALLLDGGDWKESRSRGKGPLYSVDRRLGLLGPTAALDMVAKRKNYLPSCGIEPR